MADRWRYGLMKLAESAQQTAGALREAGRRYTDVETSVASGFGGR